MAGSLRSRSSMGSIMTNGAAREPRLSGTDDRSSHNRSARARRGFVDRRVERSHFGCAPGALVRGEHLAMLIARCALALWLSSLRLDVDRARRRSTWVARLPPTCLTQLRIPAVSPWSREQIRERAARLVW
jgi:hypothetical protein